MQSIKIEIIWSGDQCGINEETVKDMILAELSQQDIDVSAIPSLTAYLSAFNQLNSMLKIEVHDSQGKLLCVFEAACSELNNGAK